MVLGILLAMIHINQGSMKPQGYHLDVTLELRIPLTSSGEKVTQMYSKWVKVVYPTSSKGLDQKLIKRVGNVFQVEKNPWDKVNPHRKFLLEYPDVLYTSTVPFFPNGSEFF